MTDDIIEALTTIGNSDKIKEICEPNVSQPKQLEEWMVKRCLYALSLFRKELENLRGGTNE